DGVFNLTVVDGDRSQPTQRSRLHALIAQLPCPAEVLVVQRSGAFAVADLVVHRCKGASCHKGVVLVAELTEASEAPFEEVPGTFEVSFLSSNGAQQELGVVDAPRVAELAVERERLLASESGRRGVSVFERQNGRFVEGVGAG